MVNSDNKFRKLLGGVFGGAWIAGFFMKMIPLEVFGPVAVLVVTWFFNEEREQKVAEQNKAIIESLRK